MDITDYFARPLSGVFKRTAQASEWLQIGSFALDSGTLAVGDAVLFPGDQVELRLERGECIVEAVALDYGTDRRIARLRASLRGGVVGAAARSAGTIDVDSGVVGVCDGPDFLRALNRVCNTGTDVERYEEVYIDRLADGVRQWSVITLPGEARVTMVTVNPGWGDGRYEVYLLEAGERAIGGEVVFIPMDASHQFEEVDEHEVL